MTQVISGSFLKGKPCLCERSIIQNPVSPSLVRNYD